MNTYRLPHNFEIIKSAINVKYDITLKESTEYIHYLIRKISFDGFIKLCINKTSPVEVSPISSFANIRREPDYEKERLTTSNSPDAILMLLDDFLKANDINQFLTYYKNN